MGRLTKNLLNITNQNYDKHNKIDLKRSAKMSAFLVISTKKGILFLSYNALNINI